MYMTLTVWQNSYVHIYIIDNILHCFAYKEQPFQNTALVCTKIIIVIFGEVSVVAVRTKCSLKKFKYLALFFFLIFQLSHIRKRKEKTINSRCYSSGTNRGRPFSDSGLKTKRKKKTCQIASIFFKITLEWNKTVYIIFKGEGEMNIHTSKCTFLPFLPEKSVKDIPFTASTFTNVQLYRRNKSNTTNLEQGLSNTTTRHVVFFINGTNNFTLINCTYTTCILQLLIHRKQGSHHYKH